jgi:protein O-GlcNAc transferase
MATTQPPNYDLLVQSESLRQLFELARQHHQAGRLTEAEKTYRQILQAHPTHADSMHALGLIAHQVGRHELAIDLIRRAIALNPSPEYYNNLGVILTEQGQPESAIAELNLAIRIKPGYANAYYNLGNALRDSRQFEPAAAAYQNAIHHQPDNIFAYNNLASVLASLNRLDESVAAFKKSIQIAPQRAQTHANLGSILYLQQRPDEALDCYQQALKLNPQDTKTLFLMVNIYKDQGLPRQAVDCLRRALEIDPDNRAIADDLCYTIQFQPDYSAQDIRHDLAAWNRRHADPLAKFIQPHANDRNPDRRLRIGYVCPYFRDHALSFFIIPLLAHHNQSLTPSTQGEGAETSPLFEIFCYSDVTEPDAITEKTRNSAHHWRDISNLSDQESADLIRADRIDILVDQAMHLSGNRLRMFALKPAPVQATWVAYPGSTGMKTMDYRLTDPYLDPPHQQHEVYAETSYWLPETFWCYDSGKSDPPVNALPAPTTGHFTFGSLNDFLKINSGVLKLWGRVLRAVPNSRMLILCGPGNHRQRALDLLAVESHRIEFVEKCPRDQYLKKYNEIDLGLDPFPYNGHTTSLDAIWMGVPTVTLIGQTIVGRAGWSLLSNINLPELAARNEDEYVRIATDWSANLPRLAAIRAGLRDRMVASPLGNAAHFARNMESAYRQMWRRWCAAPDAGL